MKNTLISKEREQVLWRHLKESRGQKEYSFLSVVRSLHEEGEQLNVAELMFLQQQFGKYGGPPVVPLSVAQFFTQLVRDRQCLNVLDPAGGHALLDAWLAMNLPDTRIDVFSHLPECEEITRTLDLDSLTVHCDTMSEKGSQFEPHYDAIIACPPVGRRKESRTYKTRVGELELNDDPSSLLIADVANRLGSSGFLAFVMAPRFALDSGPRSVRRNLGHFGLHLSALLTFKPGIFAHTSISFDLVIITREQHDELFVASVPEDLAAQKELASRLWERTQGMLPSQGRLVSENQFHGLQALEAKERAAQLAKGKGLISTPFSSAVKEIRAPKRKGTEFERCVDHPHAVYLPEMAKTAATTRQEDLPERLKSYLQLLVDPKIVLPEYLAELFNTALGQNLRQAVMTGVTIPRIRKDLLIESTLYLVPVADQKRALEAKAEIHKLRNELSELESQIWERPRQVERVTEAIGKVNHEDRFEEWIETLPFPLASILRSYHALDYTDKDKYERLLHFFEALTEFLAAIHLSAFRNSSVHWPAELDQLKEVMYNQHLTLQRATFGLWRVIVERLAGTLRAMLNGKEDDLAVARSLYATADLSPLEMLSSKHLLGLLQRVNSFRNRWTGHGGAVTHLEATERHVALKKELEEFRAIVGRRFLQYELIEPGDAEILKGPIFRCRARRVMGSNPQLEHITITVTTPAQKGELYLYNPGHNEVLELIPVVQICDTPQPASYFYNRCEGAELHLVSYHFGERSEISSPEAALDALFSDFEPIDPTEEVET